MLCEVKANTEGVERSQQRNRNYEKELNGNFRTENKKYLKLKKNSLYGPKTRKGMTEESQ